MCMNIEHLAVPKRKRIMKFDMPMPKEELCTSEMLIEEMEM